MSWSSIIMRKYYSNIGKYDRIRDKPARGTVKYFQKPLDLLFRALFIYSYTTLNIN